jgi:O-antigen/teichoic acid export membrane protein
MEAGAALLRPQGLIRRIGSRVGWNVLDQALSSLTNAALSILVARNVSENAFGAFALCFTIYAVVLGVSRGLVSEPLTVRYSDASTERFRRASRGAAGSAVLVGIAVGVVLLAVAPTQSELVRDPLVALALCMPGLLLQDALRFAFISGGNPRRAAANDFLWTVVQLGGVAWLLHTGTSTAAPFVFAWGGAALAAAAYGIVQARGLPLVRSAPRWVREQLYLSRFFVAEYLTVLGAFQVALVVVAAIAGVAAVGAIRGATVVLGPLNILLFAAFAFAVPELVRRRHLALRTHVRIAGAVSGTLVAGVFVWAALMLLIPSSAGVEILGDTWHDARSVLAPVAVSLAGVAAALGPICTLKAYGAARETFRLGVLVATLLLLLGTIGVVLGDAEGAAIGFAVAQWLAVPVVWQRMLAVVRERQSEPPAGSRVEAA